MRTRFHAGRRAAALVFVILLAAPALAHRPVLEQDLRPGATFEAAAETVDPTHASSAVYGSLAAPGEVDFYKFVAGKDETIPAEVLVPVRPSNAAFRPSLAVIGRGFAPATAEQPLPFAVPEGFGAFVFNAPDARGYFHEPYSREYLYRGAEAQVQLRAGETYYVAVYEPTRRTGTYALGLGTVEHFEDVSKLGVVWNVLRVKLGMGGASVVPWLDLFALTLMLAGLAAGFGATVLSLVFELTGGSARAGWLRAQKTALTVVWPGLLAAGLGAALLYRQTALSGVGLFQAVLALLLVALHLYLSVRLTLRVRKRGDSNPVGDVLAAPPKRLLISHALALTLWAGVLLLLVWYTLMLR